MLQWTTGHNGPSIGGVNGEWIYLLWQWFDRGWDIAFPTLSSTKSFSEVESAAAAAVAIQCVCTDCRLFQQTAHILSTCLIAQLHVWIKQNFNWSVFKWWPDSRHTMGSNRRENKPNERKATISHSINCSLTIRMTESSGVIFIGRQTVAMATTSTDDRRRRRQLIQCKQMEHSDWIDI